jgi:non-ribosomal peptide synthase protein (TIGR01720 family)
MHLLAKCRAEGIHLTLNQVLRAKSLAHLARNIGPSVVLDHGDEQTNTAFALSPVQRLYLQAEGNENGSHFNQSFTTRLSRSVDATTLKQAFDCIVKCHSMLRARFVKSESGTWQQLVLQDATSSYAFDTHKVGTTADVAEIISATQKGLDIRKGPVFAVDLCDVRGSEQILFIAAHHLVVDVVSWKIIVGDLEDLLTAGPGHTLQQGLSFQTWCDKQASHTRQPETRNAVQNNPLSVQPTDLVFWGMEKRANVYGDVERDDFTIDQSISAKALDTNGPLKTDVVDLVIAATVHSFSRVFISRKAPTVFNESHGREPWESSNIDLSRTVGWFTTLFPITVPIGEDEDEVVHTVRQVKDLRRRITDNGRPYFAHQFLAVDDQQKPTQHAPMEVLFNYLGNTQQQAGSGDSFFQSVQFSEDEDEITSDVGVKTPRLALFEISASVIDGQIQMSFMYNRSMKNQKGIRRWIAECRRTLEEMVMALSEMKTPQPTIADFPLLPLDTYARLGRVMKTLPATGIATYDQVEDIYPCSAIQEGTYVLGMKWVKCHIAAA